MQRISKVEEQQTNPHPNDLTPNNLITNNLTPTPNNLISNNHQTLQTNPYNLSLTFDMEQQTHPHTSTYGLKHPQIHLTWTLTTLITLTCLLTLI